MVVIHFEGSEAIHTVELSMDMVVVDVVNTGCRIGQMAERITSELSTVTLQVVTSSSI